MSVSSTTREEAVEALEIVRERYGSLPDYMAVDLEEILLGEVGEAPELRYESAVDRFRMYLWDHWSGGGAAAGTTRLVFEFLGRGDEVPADL